MHSEIGTIIPYDASQFMTEFLMCHGGWLTSPSTSPAGITRDGTEVSCENLFLNSENSDIKDLSRRDLLAFPSQHL